MFIALIICLAIVAMFTIAALTFKWFISYDKETTNKKIQEKIKKSKESIQRDADVAIEENIKIFKKALQEKDEYIEDILKQNKELSEKLELIYKNEKTLTNDEEIIPIEEDK